MIVLNQIIIMALLITAGVICYKCGIIGKEATQSLSSLVLMVVNPIVILVSYQQPFEKRMLKGLLWSLLLALISTVISIVISKVFIRKKSGRLAVERFSCIYSNCAFMGIPLVSALYGSEGVFYLTAFVTVFNLFVWTHGVFLMEEKLNKKMIIQAVKTPAVIATFLGFALFMLKISLPDILLKTLTYLENLNTPLAMMVAGFSVANSDIKKICTNVQIYRIALTKLIIVPLVVLLFLWIAPFNADIAYPTLIASACPTGTTITMMSIRFDKNAAYASEIFSFTTVLSIITIPLIIFIAGFLL